MLHIKKEPEEVQACAVCFNGFTEVNNIIVSCDICDVTVHQSCYGIDKVSNIYVMNMSCISNKCTVWMNVIYNWCVWRYIKVTDWIFHIDNRMRLLIHFFSLSYYSSLMNLICYIILTDVASYNVIIGLCIFIPPALFDVFRSQPNVGSVANVKPVKNQPNAFSARILEDPWSSPQMEGGCMFCAHCGCQRWNA